MSLSLYLGDAVTVIRGLPPRSIDAIICDPPYGSTRNAWDVVIPFADMWSAIDHVLKPSGVCVFTATNPFASLLVASRLNWYRHDWVWRKNKASGHLNAKRAPLRAHELVLVFCGNAPYYAPQKTHGHAPVNAFHTRRNGRNYGSGDVAAGGGSTERYSQSVIDIACLNNDDPERVHPTQKPVALMRHLVASYTRPDDMVLDFAMGSGTTGVACLELGRGFVGIDSDAEMVAHAHHRLRAVKTAPSQ